MSKKREKIRSKTKRLEKIIEMSDKLYEEQFDEDTVPVDIGEVVKLLCLIADHLKDLEKT